MSVGISMLKNDLTNAGVKLSGFELAEYIPIQSSTISRTSRIAITIFCRIFMIWIFPDYGLFWEN